MSEDRPESTFVVGHLYNDNGMAAWCLEAASALAEAGHKTVLVADAGLELDVPPGLILLRCEPDSAPRRKGLVHSLLSRLDKKSDAISRLMPRLGEMHPGEIVVLSNSSSTYLAAAGIDEYVVAWSRPVHLAGYVSKLRSLSGSGGAKDWIVGLLDLVGWWRSDWRAYRGSRGVLAVTAGLADDLARRGVRALAVHPPIRVASSPCERSSEGPMAILIAAENLDAPRKRVRFMIDALRDSQTMARITLAGKLSHSLREHIEGSGLNVEIKGSVPRSTLMGMMDTHDVFLFASELDDWGYVIVEAMSRAMCVVVPDAYPFDEIVGEAGLRYDPSAAESLSRIMAQLDVEPARRLGSLGFERAKAHFSRESFAQKIVRLTQEASR